MEKLKQLLVKLAFCKGIGNLGCLKVLSYCIKMERTDLTAEEIIHTAGIQRFRGKFSVSWEQADEKVGKNRRRYFTILDEVYPEYLREIYNPPCVIFYEGNTALLETRMMAIVGARDASPYAGKVIQSLLPKLVEADYTIVSGLAKGVDSLAHKLTISQKGRTIGVLGNGIDYFYPKEGQYLQEKMKREHLVLSEYPDGSQPKKYHFPMRNRIIAGLSIGTCVIEAKQRSGSLITAQLALEYGREVFAVPGEMLDPRSAGCLELIQDGAKCVISSHDILSELPKY